MPPAKTPSEVWPTIQYLKARRRDQPRMHRQARQAPSRRPPPRTTATPPARCGPRLPRLLNTATQRTPRSLSHRLTIHSSLLRTPSPVCAIPPALPAPAPQAPCPTLTCPAWARVTPPTPVRRPVPPKACTRPTKPRGNTCIKARSFRLLPKRGRSRRRLRRSGGQIKLSKDECSPRTRTGVGECVKSRRMSWLCWLAFFFFSEVDVEVCLCQGCLCACVGLCPARQTSSYYSSMWFSRYLGSRLVVVVSCRLIPPVLGCFDSAGRRAELI
jgi:hypothetical protein